MVTAFVPARTRGRGQEESENLIEISTPECGAAAAMVSSSSERDLRKESISFDGFPPKSDLNLPGVDRWNLRGLRGRKLS